MPRDVNPPRVERIGESRTPFQRAAKDVVFALFRENGGHKCAIDVFGFSLQRAYRYTSHHTDDHLSFWRVAALTNARATAAARYLARLADGVFCPVPTTMAATTIAAVADAVREHGECITKTLEAMADGKITPDEVPGLVKEIDESVAALATLRGLIVQAGSAGR